jgi:hypothetical protein
MRAVLGLIACVVFVAACTSQAPTPTPQPSATVLPTATAAPSPTSTIDPNAPPMTVLGLPVLSVSRASGLIDAGEVDGRFLAIGGYWHAYFLPCRYMPHVAPLAQQCGFGVLTDAQIEDPFAGPMGPNVPGRLSPALVVESVGSLNMGDSPDPEVVAVVHLADSRSWQCAAQGRGSCLSRSVLDRMVWSDGQYVDPGQFQPEITTTMTTADASEIAATLTGGQVVVAYPLDATSLNDVDPRLIGQGPDIVWLTRVVSGAPDEDGTAAGEVVLIEDATGSVISRLGLEVNELYQPARVILDTNGLGPGSVPDAAHFSISAADQILAQGNLESSSAPFALEPGDYMLTAWAASGAITDPPQNIHCEADLSLAAGDDVAYYADWPGGGECRWVEGVLFP